MANVRWSGIENLDFCLNAFKSAIEARLLFDGVDRLFLGSNAGVGGSIFKCKN